LGIEVEPRAVGAKCWTRDLCIGLPDNPNNRFHRPRWCKGDDLQTARIFGDVYVTVRRGKNVFDVLEFGRRTRRHVVDGFDRVRTDVELPNAIIVLGRKKDLVTGQPTALSTLEHSGVGCLIAGRSFGNLKMDRILNPASRWVCVGDRMPSETSFLSRLNRPDRRRAQNLGSFKGPVLKVGIAGGSKAVSPSVSSILRQLKRFCGRVDHNGFVIECAVPRDQCALRARRARTTFVNPLPTTSSHESQAPHGVGQPAQLRWVADKIVYAFSIVPSDANAMALARPRTNARREISGSNLPLPESGFM
jgi:hypothetical protein